MINRLVLVTAAGVATLLAAGTGLVLADTPDPITSPAANGTALSFESPSPPIAADPTTASTVAPAAPSSEISREEAASIALAHVGSGQVREIEREFEHGRREWKVEIVDGRQEHDVRVDATTGAVTRTDRDDRGGRDDDRGRDDRGRDD